MMQQYLNKVPRTHYGRRSLGYLKSIKENKIVIIFGKTLESSGELEKIKALLPEKEVVCINPLENNLSEIKRVTDKIKKTELIISIGGGNIMDFSKLLRITLDNPETILEEINNSTELNKQTNLIIIPTTPSTGSQVTPVAITHNKEESTKLIILHELNIPDEVILSSKLLKTISKKQMAEFICDIFAHSAEAYLSRLSNSFIKNLAEMNIESLLENWKKYLESEGDLISLENISINGQTGGICQGNAFVGVMHSLSHQLEMITGISHSRALLNIIKPVLEWYNKNLDKEVFKKFINQFDELRFDEYRENIFENINKEDLAKKTLADPSIKTSPIIFNEEKIQDLITWISIKK